MKKIYPDSKVEVRGIEARHYDFLMNLVSFGRYGKFMEKAIKFMDIKSGDKILDFGSGTGRNACLMRENISEKGKIVGVDIGMEMIRQFIEKCGKYKNVELAEKRIDKKLNFKNFDKVFISFVLHGFPQKVRDRVLENAYLSLKKGGKIFILDYNEGGLEEKPFYFRIFFRVVECRYAYDFIKRRWKGILKKRGFKKIKEYFFFNKSVRLIEGVK